MNVCLYMRRNKLVCESFCRGFMSLFLFVCCLYECVARALCLCRDLFLFLCVH